MTAATPVDPAICHIQVFPPGVQVAFSVKDPHQPGDYSMRRHPQMTKPDPVAAHNIRHYAGALSFSVSALVLPKRWPHGDRIFLVGDDASFDLDPRTGTLNPKISSLGLPEHENSCDGFITKSPNFVLGVQGADCPMLFLYDPAARIIGAVHCGWRPVARHIIRAAIDMFSKLGSDPANIHAYIGPGAGDDVYTFCDADEPPEEASAIFAEKNRGGDLLTYLRPRTEGGGFTLALNALVQADLLRAGLLKGKITNDPRSCILEPSLHSYRRDRIKPTGHGLSLGTIRLC